MSNTDHTSRAHALLSASGSSRWLNCTPSARLEEKFEESRTSVYAEEGTLAHELADLRLHVESGKIPLDQYIQQFKSIKKDALYSSEMSEHVDTYVQLVFETWLGAKKKTPGAELIIEDRVDYSHLVEQGFGTNDAAIIADEVLEIIDLKYGKGVQVDAENNTQLMLYASGALQKYELSYDIETIKLTIVQPRLNHYSTWEISAEDLKKWGETIVRPKAAKAYLGKGKAQAGDWCKWCKVKAMCGTLAAKNVKLAKHEFKDPYLLTDKQIMEVHAQIPMLKDWATAVDKYMLDEAVNGKQWPGLKVVEGRSIRKWSDETEVVTALKGAKFEKADYTETKLLGIPKIEKLVGKSEFGDLLGHCVQKPPGKPTLVPESDKRPAITGVESAKNDFNDG